MLLRAFVHGRSQAQIKLCAFALSYSSERPLGGLSNNLEGVADKHGKNSTIPAKDFSAVVTTATPQLQAQAPTTTQAPDNVASSIEQTQEERERQWEAWDEEGKDLLKLERMSTVLWNGCLCMTPTVVSRRCYVSFYTDHFCCVLSRNMRSWCLAVPTVQHVLSCTCPPCLLMLTERLTGGLPAQEPEGELEVPGFLEIVGGAAASGESSQIWFYLNMCRPVRSM
jgi:hypothetical protein